MHIDLHLNFPYFNGKSQGNILKGPETLWTL